MIDKIASKMSHTVVMLLLVLVLLDHTNPIKIHCNHPEQINEDLIHLCCKHPDGHNDIVDKCAKTNNVHLPGTNEEAIEDLSVARVVNGLCFGDCVFRQYSFLKEDELDMNAVKQYYKRVHSLDSEYEREMVSAFEHCHGKAENATAEFMRQPLVSAMTGNFKCDPKASIILACVIHNFFHNCPKERWLGNKKCSEALAFSKKCKDALVTM